MHERMTKFINENGILPSSQYDFRTGHSTTHAAYHLIINIKEFLDFGSTTLATFADLLKAFDTVNQEALITKMNKIHFPIWMIKWIKSYLEDRMQTIVVR